MKPGTALRTLALASSLLVSATQAQERAPGAQLSVAVSAAASAEPVPAHKVARELQHAIDARQAPALPWLREVNGQRVVRVLITGQGRGADLAAVRQEVSNRGGQVLSHNPETSSALAVLPAALVAPIARRADVMHVAPDRTVGAVAAVSAAGMPSVPGFAPGTDSLRGRNDLALLGE